MEEINALFGDEVVVHFADATETQRHELAQKVLAEDEKREFAATGQHAERPNIIEGVSTTALKV